MIALIRRNTTDNDREIRDGLTSQERLQRRLDNGEITAAEYESMLKEISVQPDCLKLLNCRYAQGLITAAEYERTRKEMFTLIDSYF